VSYRSQLPKVVNFTPRPSAVVRLSIKPSRTPDGLTMDAQTSTQTMLAESDSGSVPAVCHMYQLTARTPGSDRPDEGEERLDVHKGTIGDIIHSRSTNTRQQ
jgi:hypothetical protein